MAQPRFPDGEHEEEKNLPSLTKGNSNNQEHSPKGSLRYSLKSAERLKSKKLIDQLFTQGNSITNTPFKLLWILLPEQAIYPMQMAFSAPKKNFPKAVDRNRIRRLCKEVYRQNKGIIYDFLKIKGASCAGILIYISKEMPKHEELNDKIIGTLKRFTDTYETFS